MHRIAGVPRHYDWGDPRAIPELLGREPDGRPWAELWFGAHPSAPSPVVGEDRTFGELIAEDAAALGDAAGGTLPFLLKIIAAARPLSIQTHPSAEQARVGFERENAAGVPLDAPERVYRDDRHKPELLCALTSFEAKCGFRPVAESLELLAVLGCSSLAPMGDALRSAADEASANRAALTWALTLDADHARNTTASVVDAAASVADPGRFRRDVGWIGDLAEHHPSDPAQLAVLLLNHVVLAPGEAIHLPAGNLHCYLGGMAVEVMANSDNVVRGGLTTKQVDVDELLDVVTTTSSPPELQRPAAHIHRYDVRAEEFVLTRIECEPDGGAVLNTGPLLVLVAGGDFEVTGHDDSTPGRTRLRAGEALWQGSEATYHYAGRGLLFVVELGSGRSTVTLAP